MSPESRVERGSNWPVVALALLFFGPVILAWVMVAMGWYPESTTNEGRLVEPPERMEAAGWRWVDGESFDPGWFRGRWTLLIVQGGPCGGACEELLDKTARARLALDKDRTRIELVVAHAGDARVPTDMPVRQARLPRERLRELLAAAPNGDEGPALYMIDNQGYRMLTYPMPLATEGLVSDLERLLDNADEDVERIQRLRHQEGEGT
jgi:hypothetical protein